MKRLILIATLMIAPALFSNYESDCEQADLTTVDTTALAQDLNLKQRLFNRFRSKGTASSEKLNYLSQVFGLFLRYYFGKSVYDLSRIGYEKMNPLRSTTYDQGHVTGLYLVTLLFTWRNAIDWHTSFMTESGKKIHESAHLLGFLLATCTPSLIVKLARP